MIKVNVSQTQVCSEGQRLELHEWKRDVLQVASGNTSRFQQQNVDAPFCYKIRIG